MTPFMVANLLWFKSIFKGSEKVKISFPFLVMSTYLSLQFVEIWEDWVWRARTCRGLPLNAKKKIEWHFGQIMDRYIKLVQVFSGLIIHKLLTWMKLEKIIVLLQGRDDSRWEDYLHGQQESQEELVLIAVDSTSGVICNMVYEKWTTNVKKG